MLRQLYKTVTIVRPPAAERVSFIDGFAGTPPPARRPAVKRGSRRGCRLHPGERASPVRGTVFAPQRDFPQLAVGASGMPRADDMGWLGASSSRPVGEGVLDLAGGFERTSTTYQSRTR